MPTQPQTDAADGGKENRLHACSVSVLTGFALPTSSLTAMPLLKWFLEGHENAV